MGHIHQMTLAAIDKLCQQYKTFSNVLNQKGKFGKACNKPYLKIKCKEKCSCSHKKKSKDPTEVQSKKKKSHSGTSRRRIKKGKIRDKDAFSVEERDILLKNALSRKEKPPDLSLL